MKRIMPMAVAGLFVATAAFATVGPKNPFLIQNDAVVTDTIPDQDQVTPPTTFPTQTEPVKTDTEPTPMVTEPTKDDQTKVEEDTTTYPAIEQEDTTTSPVIEQEDTTTTETDTTGNGW